VRDVFTAALKADFQRGKPPVIPSLRMATHGVALGAGVSGACGNNTSFLVCRLTELVLTVYVF
jgi:hypothetical protein